MYLTSIVYPLHYQSLLKALILLLYINFILYISQVLFLYFYIFIEHFLSCSFLILHWFLLYLLPLYYWCTWEHIINQPPQKTGIVWSITVRRNPGEELFCKELTSHQQCTLWSSFLAIDWEDVILCCVQSDNNEKYILPFLWHPNYLSGMLLLKWSLEILIKTKEKVR